MSQLTFPKHGQSKTWPWDPGPQFGHFSSSQTYEGCEMAKAQPFPQLHRFWIEKHPGTFLVLVVTYLSCTPSRVSLSLSLSPLGLPCQTESHTHNHAQIYIYISHVFTHKSIKDQSRTTQAVPSILHVALHPAAWHFCCGTHGKEQVKLSPCPLNIPQPHFKPQPSAQWPCSSSAPGPPRRNSGLAEPLRLHCTWKNMEKTQLGQALESTYYYRNTYSSLNTTTAPTESWTVKNIQKCSQRTFQVWIKTSSVFPGRTC